MSVTFRIADIAILARTLELDIAIDLKRIHPGQRTGIFAFRACSHPGQAISATRVRWRELYRLSHRGSRRDPGGPAITLSGKNHLFAGFVSGERLQRRVIGRPSLHEG